MILVITGIISWDFSRLIKEMDRIAGKIDEEVVMQISDTHYLPHNAKYFRFTSEEEYERLFESARVIVSHAGAGTIITALQRNKPIIVVPRRKEYGEQFDNHQVEIARELEREGRIKVVWDVRELEEALNGVNENFTSIEKDKKLVLSLKDYINKLEKSKKG